MGKLGPLESWSDNCQRVAKGMAQRYRRVRRRLQKRRGRDILHALTIDPGESHLGLALVALDLRRVRKRVRSGLAERVSARKTEPRILDTDFDVRWVGLWNLKAPGQFLDKVATADNEAGGHSKNSLQASLRALPLLIARTPVVRTLLGDSRVHVFIEHQEGCDFENAALFQSLMRMNAIAGGLFTFFTSHGHPVRLLGKVTKWGYSSFKKTKNYALLNSHYKRQRRKACGTYFVSDMIKRQQLTSDEGILAKPLTATEEQGPAWYRRIASQQLYDRHAKLSFDDRAHSADAILGAMFELRRIAQPTVKTHKNVIYPDSVWDPIAHKAVEHISYSTTRGKPSSTQGKRRPYSRGQPSSSAKKKTYR